MLAGLPLEPLVAVGALAAVVVVADVVYFDLSVDVDAAGERGERSEPGERDPAQVGYLSRLEPASTRAHGTFYIPQHASCERAT